MFCHLVFVYLGLVFQIEAFNISPQPNLVINYPKHLKTFQNQTRSSYFGYSLVIRSTTIIVGAPRAQSTLEQQSTLDEPGGIYMCSLKSGVCDPYVLDSVGDVDDPSKCTTFNYQRKDQQWLGASMDGGIRDEDNLLVCAPRFNTRSLNSYHMAGVCYWVPNTINSTPDRVMRISPLRLKSLAVIPEDKEKGIKPSFYYMYGEMGLSAHVTDDNSRFLIGAVGIDLWKGSLILDFPENQSSVGRTIQNVDSNNCELENKNIRVPDPTNWGQEEDSYFGYAVSSGYFDSDRPSKLLYVATAPHSNSKVGEAYIFDLTENGTSINKYHTFQGEQFGEYFGYSVLVEDLNGDEKPDIIISAPQLALPDSLDDGAIYVFINKGSFNFERTIIRSPAGSNGRFGTSLSRLGDINRDGYNDVAVGAPFAGNGSVFIYLGCEYGLRGQPSQRLEDPSQLPSMYGSHTFGHGLSRGSDIDGNGFNDFAIGAPNAEVTYLYYTYPVVKVKATIKSQLRLIKPKKEKVNITACYRLETNATKMQEQELDIRITIDGRLKKDKLEKEQPKISFKAVAGPDETCKPFEIQVLYNKQIFIELVMQYELTKKVPDSREFCKTCALVDPSDPKMLKERIFFNTDCATDICVVDLQLISKNWSSTYVLGTTKVLALNYEIINHGETAYEPRFNMTTSPRVPFAKVPGNCQVTNAVMVCDLSHEGYLTNSSSESITIIIDVSQVSGKSLSIQAEVFSLGYENNATDNKYSKAIALKEFADIDATGGPTNDIPYLKFPYSAEIVNQYEVKSHGPSTIDHLAMSLYIPVAYRKPDSTKVISIIDVSSLKMHAKYDFHLLHIQLYDQNNFLIKNFTQIGQDHGKATVSTTWSHRETTNTNELLLKKNPDNTIVVDCHDTNTALCVRAEMRIKLMPGKPVNLNVSFMVDLKDVEDSWEYFVINTDLTLLKKGDPISSSFNIIKKIKSNIIYKIAGLSIWIIIMAVIGGALLLCGITYSLYKLGFFKRAEKEKLKNLIRQSFHELDEDVEKDMEPELHEDNFKN
ncbi:integrin alpha-PS3-like [Drosophila eugracilis]|uniref:integrin alpha-PS3-like n=1 Tax=Drosophila eugracilis TaxID=29029 RepID=UPI0007E8A000|nr:integrin alpha-PS3-like [Drosophila eugracilis]